MPWLPEKFDVRPVVEPADRAVEKKPVREDKTRKVHMVRHEVQRPMLMKPVVHLQPFRVPEPEFRPCPEPLTARVIEAKPIKAELVNVRKPMIRERRVEHVRVRVARPKAQDRDAPCTIEAIRTTLANSVQKDPPYIDECDL